MHLPKHLINQSSWQRTRSTNELQQFVENLHQRVEHIDLEVSF